MRHSWTCYWLRSPSGSVTEKRNRNRLKNGPKLRNILRHHLCEARWVNPGISHMEFCVSSKKHKLPFFFFLFRCWPERLFILYSQWRKQTLEQSSLDNNQRDRLGGLGRLFHLLDSLQSITWELVEMQKLRPYPRPSSWDLLFNKTLRSSLEHTCSFVKHCFGQLCVDKSVITTMYYPHSTWTKLIFFWECVCRVQYIYNVCRNCYFHPSKFLPPVLFLCKGQKAGWAWAPCTHSVSGGFSDLHWFKFSQHPVSARPHRTRAERDCICLHVTRGCGGRVCSRAQMLARRSQLFRELTVFAEW